MPDRRRHRGPAPEDAALFAPGQLPRLRAAVLEHAWLLTRGYAPRAALELVGDHHQLVTRQRLAVGRVACSDQARARRAERRLTALALAGRTLQVDGFNACIGMEVASSGGLLLVGRDGAYRDLASVQGTYRRVLETPRSLDLLIEALSGCNPASVTWYLDSPVSNSGALAAMLRARFDERGLGWTASLVSDADRHVSAPGGVAVSADSGVLDAAEAWFDLTGWTVRRCVPEAWVLDLAPGDG